LFWSILLSFYTRNATTLACFNMILIHCICTGLSCFLLSWSFLFLVARRWKWTVHSLFRSILLSFYTRNATTLAQLFRYFNDHWWISRKDFWLLVFCWCVVVRNLANLTVNCAVQNVTTMNCAVQNVTTMNCAVQNVTTMNCAAQNVKTMNCTAQNVTTMNCAV